MNVQTYNHQTIIEYLLGSLPQAEAEMFDELSVTNDEFTDQLTAAEKDLVDAYVNGELSANHLERFQTYYLASPLRRERVEFAKTFQAFASKELAVEVAAEPSKKEGGFFSNLFTIPRLSLQWGFALATLMLVFFGALLFWENSRLRSEISQTASNRDEILKRETQLQEREKQLQDEITNQQTTAAEAEKELAKIRQEREKLEQELKNSQEQKRLLEQRKTEPQRELAQDRPSKGGQGIGLPSIISFILSPSLRGGNELRTLSIPQRTTFVAMQLKLEPNDYQQYKVVLQNSADGTSLWQSSKIKANELGGNKTLKIKFPTKLLKSQIYFLEVSGINAADEAEIISNYSFRAVIK